MVQRVTKQTFDKLQLRFVNRCLRFTKHHGQRPEVVRKGGELRARYEQRKISTRSGAPSENQLAFSPDIHWGKGTYRRKGVEDVPRAAGARQATPGGKTERDAVCCQVLCFTGRTREQVKPFWHFPDIQHVSLTGLETILTHEKDLD